jgi:hypothetical protein
MNRTTILRVLFWLAVLGCAVIAIRGRAQALTGHQPAHSKLIGVWRADADGLPAVTMVISDEGGSLKGAVLFYLHKREEVGKPYTSTPGLPEPMLNLKLDGATLTFQISHRRAHPPRTLSDPPVTFHMLLQGRDSASLSMGDNVSHGEAVTGIAMVRSDY